MWTVRIRKNDISALLDDSCSLIDDSIGIFSVFRSIWVKDIMDQVSSWFSWIKCILIYACQTLLVCAGSAFDFWRKRRDQFEI